MPTAPAPTAIIIFDIDGVIRDVSQSYRRALADTVEHFTEGGYRPTQTDIDQLKAEGQWNNDWEASRELIYRFFEQRGTGRSHLTLEYEAVVRFFQSRYRGDNWTGYIQNEPLLAQPAYLEALSADGLPWGFFSGATRGSATFVLEQRLHLQQPILVAMEDAPGKPDPTGLFDTVRQVEARHHLPPGLPVVYAGDTVADMHTAINARRTQPQRQWIGVGILPPHVLSSVSASRGYTDTLLQAEAAVVLSNIQQLTSRAIAPLIT
ncbi:MAG: TIGR01548 family HAD-type hydrolase [Kaiparowitsia implicata GSE-PSE-MK54-09C]|jgi:HAD superfamily phosphatase|nr:TIGR01548 family HAD-type hydrolase [Kaiparowitsia implicata GSE-PSE-MK54-09C]